MKPRTPEQQLVREFIFHMLFRRGHTLVDYVRPRVEAGMSRAEIIAMHVEEGFFDEEIEGALNSLRCSMTTATQKAYRKSRFVMMSQEGITLPQYIKPMVDFGHSRAFIIAHFVALGFFDEEIDGALIALGVFPDGGKAC